MDKGKVLILDARNGNPDSITKSIEEEGFVTIRTSDLGKVQELVLSEKPKALLVDQDSFGDEVWEIYKNLKDDFDTRKTALIIISSNNDENQVVRAYQVGADDYIIKPFSSKSTVARMKAIIERVERSESKKIKVKDIEIDLDEHKVKKSGKPIDLTYIQFKLLYLLASRRENVFSRKEILEKVWGRKVYVTNRTVDVHIKRLREKLGEYKYPSQYIETIHGTGYRFL
ncbi:MAG: response regulator transcription factor [candidate division KSB1 bacterium]|nr:response regulator transcription factor [candidate division KSB1 bacterium]MDZ7336516.1 response regulator transcription factor [candidate division KSB1 bacterium]MDZ7358604.1 response regulator transcription factor [candidate division KSB1 bacterium]MDZ7401831.1 response regulator transcription factor [candidate division KSB1 bacterium]